MEKSSCLNLVLPLTSKDSYMKQTLWNMKARKGFGQENRRIGSKYKVVRMPEKHFTALRTPDCALWIKQNSN